MLAGEVAKQRNDPSMYGGDANRRGNVAIDAAGAAVAKEQERVVAAAGMSVQVPDGQRIADEDGGVCREFVDQNTDVSGAFSRRSCFQAGKSRMPAVRGGIRRHGEKCLTEGDRVRSQNMGQALHRVGPARPGFDQSMYGEPVTKKRLQVAGDRNGAEAQYPIRFHFLNCPRIAQPGVVADAHVRTIVPAETQVGQRLGQNWSTRRRSPFSAAYRRRR